MLNYLVACAATAVAFLLIDLLWLGLIAKSFYRHAIGHLMADPPNLLAAGVFYLLYPLGVMLFAEVPTALYGGGAARADLHWSHAVLTGALFGLFAYATYDLRNMATLRD